MNRKKLILTSITLILTILFLCLKLSNTNNKYSKTYYYLGTINEITLLGKSKSESENLLNYCDNILKNIENKMSDTLPNSEISKINLNAGKEFIKVSDETFFVIQESIKYSNLSEGNFDITIGPISDLWSFGTDDAKVPSNTEITNNLNLVNYKDIILNEDNKSVKLKKQDMKIDLGAIAKGYAADTIANYLKSNDVKSAIINLGGNIYTLGSKSNKDQFTIGIQNPTMPRGNSIGSLQVSNKSIVTSGIYERYIKYDDKIYHHLLNPFTGYPFENDLLSVTIISDKSIICDSLSTSVFGLGLEKGLNLIEKINNTDAIFITKNKEIYLTSNLNDKFTLNDTSFKLKKDE